ncbi:hypothetical protein ACUN9Y_17860 [Halomonas sp. V046]|uniref:hypothetical protein n=1 Tax=Halomonas sp. V046 TaxID=3459611 RepID=UPI004043A3C8
MQRQESPRPVWLMEERCHEKAVAMKGTIYPRYLPALSHCYLTVLPQGEPHKALSHGLCH